MRHPSKVKIVEVGPRDGLQNEPQPVSTDVKVSVVWANSWFDPPREAALANALMDAGADVLFQTTDSSEVIKAAQARGRHAIGIDSDMSAYGPSAHLASVVGIFKLG